MSTYMFSWKNMKNIHKIPPLNKSSDPTIVSNIYPQMNIYTLYIHINTYVQLAVTVQIFTVPVYKFS